MRWRAGATSVALAAQTRRTITPADAGEDESMSEDFGRFFEISLDHLCVLHFDGRFRHLNPSWERTLGFSLEELRARPFIHFVHPDDRERTLEQNRRVRSGEQALGFENRYLCRDGSHRWFLWNATADVERRVIYSVARDITARRQAEEERERLVGELQAALSEVRVLREMLPICSYCRRVRADEHYWQGVEDYLGEHTRFSHAICPRCYEVEVEPMLRDDPDEGASPPVT